MKKTCLFMLIILAAGCGRQIRTDVSKITLNNFFERCDFDTKNAAEIISSKKLVSALFHLNRMNNGGSHYYILEKDATTEMLNKLSTYKYSECILITNEGKIIYTMYDNSLLGKSIYSIPGNPFGELAEKSLKNEPAVSDSVNFATANGSYANLTFSRPVYEEGEQKGVLITSVPTEYLKNELPEKTYVVDRNGMIKYHPMAEMNGTADPLWGQRNSDGIYKKGGRTVLYTEMNFGTVTWFIASEN